jgi:hypothetical protein
MVVCPYRLPICPVHPNPVGATLVVAPFLWVVDEGRHGRLPLPLWGYQARFVDFFAAHGAVIPVRKQLRPTGTFQEKRRSG